MFEKKLIELRKKEKLSQYKLAQKLNCAQSTIGMWESGKRQPSFEMLIVLAEFFNVSTDYILTGKEHSKSEVQRLFDLLPDYKQNRVLGYIRSLAEDEGLVVKSNR